MAKQPRTKKGGRSKPGASEPEWRFAKLGSDLPASERARQRGELLKAGYIEADPSMKDYPSGFDGLVLAIDKAERVRREGPPAALPRKAKPEPELRLRQVGEQIRHTNDPSLPRESRRALERTYREAGYRGKPYDRDNDTGGVWTLPADKAQAAYEKRARAAANNQLA